MKAVRALQPNTCVPRRCICGNPATGRVEAVMLNNSVALAIGTCDRHAPKSNRRALALVRALLQGIADSGDQRKSRQDAANRGGGHGR